MLSFIASVDPKLANTDRWFLANEKPIQWGIRMIWVKIMGDILQAAMLPSYHAQEGKILDLDEESFISEIAHKTAKMIHSVDSDSTNSILIDSSLSNQEPIPPDPKKNRPPHPSFLE